MTGHEAWSLGPDLGVDPDTFRDYARRAARRTRDRDDGDRT